MDPGEAARLPVLPDAGAIEAGGTTMVVPSLSPSGPALASGR
jgi:hypothetical protein